MQLLLLIFLIGHGLGYSASSISHSYDCEEESTRKDTRVSLGNSTALWLDVVIVPDSQGGFAQRAVDEIQKQLIDDEFLKSTVAITVLDSEESVSLDPAISVRFMPREESNKLIALLKVISSSNSRYVLILHSSHLPCPFFFVSLKEAIAQSNRASRPWSVLDISSKSLLLDRKVLPGNELIRLAQFDRIDDWIHS